MRCSHSNCRMLAKAQLKSQNCLSKPSQSARRLRSAAFQLPNKNKNGSRRIPSTPVAQTSTSCNAAVTLPFWSGSRSRGRTTRTSQPSERLLNSWGKYLRGDPIGDKAAAMREYSSFRFPGDPRIRGNCSSISRDLATSNHLVRIDRVHSKS
jgi:hypothetical protein